MITLVLLLLILSQLLLIRIPIAGTAEQEQSVTKRAEQLSRALRSLFEDGTKVDQIEKAYADIADAEEFDARAELDALKAELEAYLRTRAQFAWKAKLSLEQRKLVSQWVAEREPGSNFTLDDLNAPESHHFVRYLNAKRLSDAAMHYQQEDGEDNASKMVTLRPNPNFYGLNTSSDASAVHVPTPIYNRDPQLLERIAWSDIDQQYRRNREQLKDLSFQKFCSESGFLRYFPAAPWLWEDRYSELDLFDCRNTEWYVDAATAPRNLIILLDTSGSMLGQRFEIARQTIEAILGTLSDNDFFNIIHFSKQAHLLEECAGRELVQATLRNKKLLLSRLFGVNSEGKADYEMALHKAFVALMNLPEEGVQWRSKEEAAREAATRREAGSPELEPGMQRRVLEDNVLMAPARFMQAIRKFASGKQQQQQRMGCQDMIMLITDGAPGFFREVFELYNKDKQVRFFSFVVGEEAKDFEQVKWMSCANRGFMAHISSMADVQEKVQKYVRILSRTVARQKAAFTESTPVWSGTTRERMSDEFVVSVSFPVVLPDGQFMGVSSATVPLTELAQLAHPSLIGARSHFALLDGSGYVMAHPQLRSLEMTGELKAGFNSVEWPDVEVQRAHSSRAFAIDCNTGTVEPVHRHTLFAVENMRHVYPQKNHYLAACIDGTPYSVVLAAPAEDNKRLRRVRPLGDLQMGWLRGADWRLHPKWRYCHLNDSDAALGPEQAFRDYVKQMRSSGGIEGGGKMPELCRDRRGLVDRALLDLQASAGFGKLWQQEWERNRKNGVHLAFFAASSGVVRFHNASLGDRMLYEQPAQPKAKDDNATATQGNSEENRDAYKHFVLQLHPNTPEADFYRRAVRAPPAQINFDLNRQTRLWQHGRKTGYGHAENETLLALAYKAVRVDGALAGVAGVEFLYDALVSQMRHIGCMPETDRSRCYLLDEHGYVLFSSNRDTRYTDFAHANIVVPQMELATARNMTLAGRRRKGHRAYIAARVAQQHGASAHSPPTSHQLELGRFFGQLNRVAEWAMELMVERGLYKRLHFTDAQAVCDQHSVIADPSSASPTATGPTAATASAQRVSTLLLPLISTVLNLFLRFSALISGLLLPAELASALQLNTFASLLKVNDGRFPCRQHSTFYLAQPDVKPSGPNGALLDSDSYERPCSQNAAQCAVRVFASWVPHTNLMLLMIRQDSRSQCFHADAAAHCPLSQPPAVPFGFSAAEPVPSAEELEPELRVEAHTCTASRPQPSKQPQQCLRDDFIENESEDDTCAGSGGLRPDKSPWLRFAALLLLSFISLCSAPYIGDSDR